MTCGPSEFRPPRLPRQGRFEGLPFEVAPMRRRKFRGRRRVARPRRIRRGRGGSQQARLRPSQPRGRQARATPRRGCRRWWRPARLAGCALSGRRSTQGVAPLLGFGWSRSALTQQVGGDFSHLCGCSDYHLSDRLYRGGLHPLTCFMFVRSFQPDV